MLFLYLVLHVPYLIFCQLSLCNNKYKNNIRHVKKYNYLLQDL